MIRLVSLSLLLAYVVMGLDPNVLEYADDETMMDSGYDSDSDEDIFADEKRFYMKEQDDNKALRSEIHEFERDSHMIPQVIMSYPTDCADLKRAGVNESGVYYIYPFSCTCVKSVEVYCDMDADGGGWTILLLRKNQGAIGQLDFNQTWEAYKRGFGEADKEYWIGNDNIYHMTHAKGHTLRMDFTNTYGRRDSLIYSTFSIEAEVPHKYRASLGSYMAESTLGSNCFSSVNGSYFSTHDKDNDNSGSNCAAMTKGAWWFSNCDHHGFYIPPTSYYNNHMNISCNYKDYEVTDFSMKIRPIPCEDTRKLINIGSCTDQCF